MDCVEGLSFWVDNLKHSQSTTVEDATVSNDVRETLKRMTPAQQQEMKLLLNNPKVKGQTPVE